mmetsp:Transcript_101629/g.292746  ORF Transcript_101629/g.292746 Transcript_101629/m.292746 type:complete len:307 (+) Transcript_101629:198-1118(+)
MPEQPPRVGVFGPSHRGARGRGRTTCHDVAVGPSRGLRFRPAQVAAGLRGARRRDLREVVQVRQGPPRTPPSLPGIGPLGRPGQARADVPLHPPRTVRSSSRQWFRHGATLSRWGRPPQAPRGSRAERARAKLPPTDFVEQYVVGKLPVHVVAEQLLGLPPQPRRRKFRGRRLRGVRLGKQCGRRSRRGVDRRQRGRGGILGTQALAPLPGVRRAAGEEVKAPARRRGMEEAHLPPGHPHEPGQRPAGHAHVQRHFRSPRGEPTRRRQPCAPDGAGPTGAASECAAAARATAATKAHTAVAADRPG